MVGSARMQLRRYGRQRHTVPSVIWEKSSTCREITSRKSCARENSGVRSICLKEVPPE